MSKKGAVDVYASIIIMVTAVTFASTLYLYSSGVIKGTMTENFKLVDIFGNRVIIKNIGREDIKDLKCMVDGIERRCVISEASIIPGQSGNVLIEGITPGIHELQLYTKSMSERLTWKAEENSIVDVPNPTAITTATIIIEETKIIELSTSPDNPHTPQNITVKCKALRATGDTRTLHLDIRLKNPSGNEILDSGNLGDDELDVTYEILTFEFTETGDYKVICNLRETSLLPDPLIDSKNTIVSYSTPAIPSTTTTRITTTTRQTTTTRITTTTRSTTTIYEPPEETPTTEETTPTTKEGGGGCPILKVFDGKDFVTIEKLNIHAPAGWDIKYTSKFNMQPKCGKYEIILHEAAYNFWDGSHIDYVKLTDEKGNECRLISAVHSKNGDVLSQIVKSDDVRVRTFPEQEIKLVFDNCSGNKFTFMIEGYNAKCPGGSDTCPF